MREIKFRGKCVEDSEYAGEWVVGGCSMPDEDVDSKKYGNEWLITVYLGGNCSCSYHVIPETVGQFTGLYDKNNKPIYEGDIILMENVFGYGTCKGVIKWDDNGYWYTDYKGDYDNRIMGAKGFVIGNVYDNPELLKGETK